MRDAIRSLWREPRAVNNPGKLWWDSWLVVAVVVSAFLEGFLRGDVLGRPLAISLAVGLAFGLLWRRSHPLVVAAIAFGLVTVMNIVALIRSDPSFGLYTMGVILLIPYAIVRWGSGREIVIGLGFILLGFVTGLAADFTNIGEAIAGFVFGTSPILIGTTVRYRTQARRRDQEGLVLRERELLARELHDTVAHHVSAIAIQSQVGQTLAATNADAPMDALRIIEQEASRTLSEMRAMVGALRQGDQPELAPLPGIADLERFAKRVGNRPEVLVELSGNLDDIATAVDAAIFRIAQESLTNAIKHAQKATTIKISVAGEGSTVKAIVRDDGAPGAGDKFEAGFGLVGMKERAKLLGGTLEAGPAPDRGWVVTAVLPKRGVRR
ncbi:MAG: sensor histidine kinase [Acidimicrobiia bacterium]